MKIMKQKKMKMKMIKQLFPIININRDIYFMGRLYIKAYFIYLVFN